MRNSAGRNRPSTRGAAFVAFALAVLAVAAVAPAAGAKSGPPRADAARIAISYVREHAAELGLRPADVNDVNADQVVSRHTGVTHVYLGQRFRGVEVFNAVTTVNVTSDGRVLNVGNRFVSDLAGVVAGDRVNRSAPQAIAAAATHLGLTVRNLELRESRDGPAREQLFNEGGISLDPITAKLVYEPVGAQVRLAWQIEISELDGEHWWNIRVDAATSDVLAKSDYVAHESYGVFPFPYENPDETPKTLVSNPAALSASPFGWHDTNGLAGPEFTITRGNNAYAYTDFDDNNKPDPGGSPDGGATLTFDFPFAPANDPSAYDDLAVTNLFYWNNVMHDVLYRYGFDEESGNFQETNYGGGGKDGDAVQAQAQDGGALGNANFSTPPDGRPGRMQMYEWIYPFSNQVRVNTPAGLGPFAASSALWGAQLDTTGVTGDVAIVNDGVAGSPGGTVTDGCEGLPAGSLTGDIALVDRGFCNFTVKAKNAQTAGAVAIIVVQNTGGSPTVMGGEDNTVTIPGVMVSRADGTTLRSNAAGLNVTLRRLAEADIPVNRDSDLDNGVIAHEYGHGVSNRLTGGPTHVTCLQNEEQMGEGWSDFMTLVFTAKALDTATTPRGVGNYLLWENETGWGIRPTPYTTDLALNPIRYATPQFTALAVPHGIGYAWASMLWEVYWNLVQRDGFADLYTGEAGNTLALQLVMDGMKMQPCSPGFVDGRDAILAADQELTGGANQCEIWRGFAKRRVGVGASQGSANKIGDEVGSTTVPAGC
jgi:hypothetical protein